MRWVPAAVVRPHRCALIPFVGSHHPRGFFDYGTEMQAFDGHVYVSVVAAEQMARHLGWVAPGDVVNANRRVADLEARLERAHAEAETLREQLGAVRVLKNAGFAQSNPPGRPKKKAVA